MAAVWLFSESLKLLHDEPHEDEELPLDEDEDEEDELPLDEVDEVLELLLSPSVSQISHSPISSSLESWSMRNARRLSGLSRSLSASVNLFIHVLQTGFIASAVGLIW